MLRSEVNNSQRLDWELKKWLTASVSTTNVLDKWYRYRYLDMYRVDQKKVCSQKTKIGHGGFFFEKISMTNKIKKFL